MSGPHAPGGPALADAARSGTALVAAELRGLVAAGELRPGPWHGVRSTPAQKSQTRSVRGDLVGDRWWDRALAGVPETYDAVTAISAGGAEVHLGSPSLRHVGDPWRVTGLALRLPGDRAEAAAHRWRDWLRTELAEPGVTHGFVHLDTVADPYGRLVVLESRLPGAGLAGRVEGYYWCVALGPAQLAALGPTARLREVCAEVEPVDVGGTEGLLCTLAASPLELTEDAVRAWRTLLLPLLRPGFPGTTSALARGPLSRPVWLFEGAPAPTGTSATLVHGAPPAMADPLPVTWEAPPGTTRLEWRLRLTGEVDERLPALVAGLLHAVRVVASAGLLAGHPEVTRLDASAPRSEQDALSWTTRTDAPLGAAHATALAGLLPQQLLELAEHPDPTAPLPLGRLEVTAAR